jgi:hypothetical protein
MFRIDDSEVTDDELERVIEELRERHPELSALEADGSDELVKQTLSLSKTMGVSSPKFEIRHDGTHQTDGGHCGGPVYEEMNDHGEIRRVCQRCGKTLKVWSP